MWNIFTSKTISVDKREGWSMSRRSEETAPDMTIQANRFTKRGYFNPRSLEKAINTRFWHFRCTTTKLLASHSYIEGTLKAMCVFISIWTILFSFLPSHVKFLGSLKTLSLYIRCYISRKSWIRLKERRKNGTKKNTHEKVIPWRHKKNTNNSRLTNRELSSLQK